jgi:hypothetical protein
MEDLSKSTDKLMLVNGFRTSRANAEANLKGWESNGITT